MDILSAAQQQINDAAKTLDPNASSGSAPPPPLPDQPTPITPSPAPVSPPEPQNPPSPLAFEPSNIGDTTKTFGSPPPPPQDSEENKTPPPQKKGIGKGVIIAGLFLLLATLPVAVYYVSQQQQQLTENRSRASGVPNGQSSGCCSGNAECIGWFGAGSTCDNLNGACGSGKQCRGGANTTGGNCHQCTQTDCNVAGCGGQTCNAGCISPCGDGICGQNENSTTCPKDCPVPTGGGSTIINCSNMTDLNKGTASSTCLISQAAACNPSNGFVYYCDNVVGNEGCKSGPQSIGSFPGGTTVNINNYLNGKNCGSVQIDLEPAGKGSNNAIGACGAILKRFSSACTAPPPPPPSGCKSDFCTSRADCAAKGGTVGTPKSFASCSPADFVACCVNVTTPAPTPTPPPLAGQCTRIKVYKNSVAVDPTTLKVGDSVTLAVAGTNATKGRIRVNGAVFVESTTLNINGEYTVPFTVPAGVPSFTIEAEVFGANGQWQ